MTNRGSNQSTPSVEATTAALQRTGLSEHPQFRKVNSAPVTPVAKGVAGRRARPGFKLSDIAGAGLGGGGASGAGLGAGRPNASDEMPMRRGSRDVMETPFSNFQTIVYVCSWAIILPPSLTHLCAQ